MERKSFGLLPGELKDLAMHVDDLLGLAYAWVNLNHSIGKS